MPEPPLKGIKSVSFHEAAELEMNEAAEYYESRVTGLGFAFLSEVERCIDIIVENPESSTPVLKNIRRKLLMHFPYSIMYSIVDDNSIRILAIANHKRRPFYWRRRK